MRVEHVFVAACVAVLTVACGKGSSDLASGPLGQSEQDAAGSEPDGGSATPAEEGEDGEAEGSGDGVDVPTEPPPIPDGGVETPIPTKIRYVLVLVKENHTFDNYFTGFPGADTVTKAKRSDGTTLTRPVAPDGRLPQDICHSNNCGKRGYANGQMNGFDRNNAGDLPFIRYTEQQIPNYWQYARNFVLVDHMFSTTLGPSAPGHSVYWTGRSLSIENPKCVLPDGGTCANSGGCRADSRTQIKTYDPNLCTTKIVPPCFDVPSLPDHLPANFTWENYGTPHALMVKSIANSTDLELGKHFRKLENLVSDLESGHIANLTIAHVLGPASEHPDKSPCPGENYTVDVINAAMKLPQWNEMAIVINWDDSGGFFDHVVPPVKACPNGEHFQSGFRVPAIVISPYAKKGFVLKAPTNQASIPRLVEELWGMSFMSARDPHALDGTSGSLMSAFDFSQTPRAPMPLVKHSCPK